MNEIKEIKNRIKIEIDGKVIIIYCEPYKVPNDLFSMTESERQEITSFYEQQNPKLAPYKYNSLYEKRNENILKKGDLCIFWDEDESEAMIAVYKEKGNDNSFPFINEAGLEFANAIKFESLEQYINFLKTK